MVAYTICSSEVDPRNIGVNSLYLGMIATKFHVDFTADKFRKKVQDMGPLGRLGSAEEIANTVAF